MGSERTLKVRVTPTERLCVTKQTPATDDLVLANMPLVGYAVSELLHRVPPSVSRDELISAGHLALVMASRAYDPTTGVPFARYASLRIRGALVDELRSMDWATRGARQKVRELASTSERLTATLGRSPSREELAGALGTDVSAVDRASQDAARRVLSMDSSDVPVAELVRDGAPNPEEALLSSERLRWLRAAVHTLPEKLRVVVDGIFLQDRSVADLADELGVTQSRISQLRTEALSLLKDGLNAGLDPDMLPVAERPEGVAERRRQKYFAAVAARAAMAPMAPRGVIPSQRPASADEAARERVLAGQQAVGSHATSA